VTRVLLSPLVVLASMRTRRLFRSLVYSLKGKGQVDCLSLADVIASAFPLRFCGLWISKCP
jgi:hypothetical protein